MKEAGTYRWPVARNLEGEADVQYCVKTRPAKLKEVLEARSAAGTLVRE